MAWKLRIGLEIQIAPLTTYASPFCDL
jgi:hypothetical protein